jgi:hypothetical protein
LFVHGRDVRAPFGGDGGHRRLSYVGQAFGLSRKTSGTRKPKTLPNPSPHPGQVEDLSYDSRNTGGFAVHGRDARALPDNLAAAFMRPGM